MSHTFGTEVLVKEYGGRELTRRVVKDLGKIVVVCNEDEYDKATGEGREPDGVGFPRASVRLGAGYKRRKKPSTTI